MKEKDIKIKVSIELILDEIKRLSEFSPNDILHVINESLDYKDAEFSTVIQNQYILDIVHLEKNKII